MADEARLQSSPRRRWIVVGVVAAAIAVVAVAILVSSGPCRAWQNDMRSARAEAASIFDQIENPPEENAAERDALTEMAIANGAELKALQADQPEGCEAPD